MSNISISVSLALSVLLSAGCRGQPAPVKFAESWPSEVTPYEESTQRWTRRSVLRASLANQGSQLLELYATFLSTDWRASFVARQVELQRLSTQSEKALTEEQQKIGSQSHQVKLLVSTYHPGHNDLHRDQSIWRVVLVDEAGTEIPAQSIKKDRRPRQLISAEFSNLGDFSEAYLVTFEYAPQLLQGDSFSLRVSSSLGTAEAFWLAQRASN